MSKTILVFSPHPDDAEFYAGGTLASMTSEGTRVFIVIATDGCCGSFELDSASLINIRAQEAQRAAQTLGAEPPLFLGYPDSGLDRLPPGELRERFIRLIRQHKPDVVIAEDAWALYEQHPDHRAVAWAVSDALFFSSLPLVHPEHLDQGLQPHFVIEKFFYGEGIAINKVIDISAFMEKKLAALSEHISQMTFLVQDILQQARRAGLEALANARGSDDPMPAIAWAMQTQAAEVGQRISVQYGEAFRYVRFHPLIERLITESSL